MSNNIFDLLNFTIKNKGSDLHLSAGSAPMYRLDGDLRLIRPERLSQRDVNDMICTVMNEAQQTIYKQDLEIDFSFQHEELGRFRANVFNQEQGSAAVFRIIPSKILSIEALGLPPILSNIACLSHGLVLVTGSAGSGKSTTLAAIIDHINTLYHKHILTIEDPIEFLHLSKNCLINQREVLRDTHSFNSALHSVLRQDPNIILVGELRDLESIRLCMTAAETGHLVFATLHTQTAAKTIHRIIDVFPGDEKSTIRSMLSGSLQAVISQTLLKKKQGGRIAAFEIMLCNPAIRSLIREDKIAQIHSTIQTGKSQGMQTLDQHLNHLVHNDIISIETAKTVAVSKNIIEYSQ